MSESACIFCRGREGDSLNHHLIATRYDLERAIAERDEALKQVESLKQELEVAQAFHNVAVRERDAAGAEVDWLRAQLARLRAWATGERGEPSL